MAHRTAPLALEHDRYDPLDRRHFLRLTGAAAGATLIGRGQASAAPSAFAGKVYRYTHDSLVRRSGEANGTAVKEALDECLIKLYRTRNAEAAWKKLFRPNDVVGIKVNCLGGPNLSNDPTVVAAVVEGLASAGVKPHNTIIFERSDRELAQAGFELNRTGKGVQCYGTECDYDSQPTTSGKVTTRLSKILSTTCTKIVNMPILKDHEIAGITGAMKNHWGCIDNPNRYHVQAGIHANDGPFIPDTYSIPQVRGKERLLICDALKGCFDGGPSYKEDCLYQPKTLLVGLDPVAMDYELFRMIERERKNRELPSLKEAGRSPNYILAAAKRGLGIRDLRRTQVIELPSA